MATCNIDSLPEELLLNILELLDRPPPSQLNSRKEPSLEVTSSVQRDYKNISVVSKRWRRISLPLLFKHTRLSLSEDISGPSSKANLSQKLSSDEITPKATSSSNGPWDYEQSNHAQAYQQVASTRSTLNLHELQNFLEFLRFNNLINLVQTFVLLASHDSEYNTHLGECDSENRYPHRETHSANKYRVSATFWQMLFSSISPIRVIIVASPSNMGRLTNCAIDMRGDWAFSDMDYHILELGVDSTVTTTLSRTLYKRDADCIPYGFPGIAKASVLYHKPWTEICLNEGSFLRAYATYEFCKYHNITITVRGRQLTVQFDVMYSRARSTFPCDQYQGLHCTRILSTRQHSSKDELIITQEVRLHRYSAFRNPRQFRRTTAVSGRA